jgi:ankyrin repeat protein
MYKKRRCSFIWLVLCIHLLAACDRTTGSRQEGKEQKQEVSGSLKPLAETGPETEEELRQAALQGDEAKVQKLLESGTNVNAVDQEGHTALMFAAFNGHSGIVSALIHGGAVVDRRDIQGQTALLFASTGPFSETVKILLDQGAKPNIIDSNEQFSPLMHAAAAGQMEVVRLLMEYGADPTLTDVDGDDAETFARQAGHVEVADFLKSILE